MSSNNCKRTIINLMAGSIFESSNMNVFGEIPGFYCGDMNGGTPKVIDPKTIGTVNDKLVQITMPYNSFVLIPPNAPNAPKQYSLVCQPKP